MALMISLASGTADAQILKDSIAIRVLTDGMHNIYNLQFREAGEAYNEISKMYPGHPVLHLYNGMKIYWENFPLIINSPSRIKFEEEMRKCIEMTDKEYSPSASYEAEYLLSNICARGLLLLFLSDNDQSDEVMPLVTSSYRPLMKTFKYTSSCHDFYYFTGVYNYYREAYPKVYPVYKAVAFLFPQGDMELGLRQLETCGKSSIALRAEAYAILSWIRMNFEADFSKALPYSCYLSAEYPENPLYKIYYLKNLLLLRKYDEAEKVIISYENNGSNRFYNAGAKIFKGILQEKKYHDKSSAAKLYHEGIKDLEQFGSYGYEYAGYGYFGLSRISEAEGNNHDRRLYRRKAMDLVDFKKINFDDQPTPIY